MKHLFVMILAALSLSAFGQTGSSAAQNAERGFMGWVHSAWQTVQKEGKPAAEKIAKQFPERFKAVRATVENLSTKVHRGIDSMNLEQKRNTLVQIWRVRKSLDLMALLSPEMLQELTGLDTTGLRALEDQTAKMAAVVTAKIHTNPL